MAWVWTTDYWVLPWRLGAGLWIGGCVAYLWPPLRSEYLRDGGHVSNALQVGGMLGWAVGSAFAFHDDTDIGAQACNAGYLGGSALLLLDALLQARQLSSATCSRGEKVSLIADLLAGIFYVLAGAFGGYATHLSLIRFGNVCWLIGSVISGVRPCLALRTDCARPVAADVELGAAGAGDHA